MAVYSIASGLAPSDAQGALETLERHNVAIPFEQ
jgi:hypothetical protein